MTDHQVIVRRARAEDIPGLVASSAGLFAEDGGTRDSSVNVDWPRQYGAQTFAAALEDPARLVLAVERDGQVVGHLLGTATGPTAKRRTTSATLVSIYVRPEHRRARAGDRLVEEFLDWARRQGAEHAEVTAYATNTEAIRFYERGGFTAMTLTLRQAL
ncbi:GNAT family N-acetyltransferase [Streptomyces spinosirectus]|uniref:GNAT family N-acetyltransferase n=1 Tax=Streptomyces TaxID=1883 RepID=UPI001C9DECD1|nr:MULTISPECIES: GNAT family N-acetyltransferase [Streptomyces]MBY8343639.1 GNAT family N-acetyltransferase [Streptomyces plumbidurans]UIR22080.1 GNAT family N-acetyltransferase [Streptomyces spinosirectus]